MTATADELSRAAVIGLGANLAEPAEMIREALRRLAETPGLRLLAASSLYLTEPQGGPQDQNWYHNAVAFFDSRLTPRALLDRLLAVEAALGRRRLERYGPRVIDLDFLAQGDLVVEAPPDLVVPHPRMHQRLFVLGPLAEVNPGWHHPLLGRTAAELLADLPTEGQGLKKLDGQTRA